MDVGASLWDALLTGAGLFWRAFWALAFGYAISATIQIFLSRGEAAKYLGDAKPKKVGLAMLLGFDAPLGLPSYGRHSVALP